jgi:DNA-directed RNA polymerase
MKKHVEEYIEKFNQQDVSVEYKCVNALQHTPWRINSFVCDVLRTAWNSGQQWQGLPPRDNAPVPPYPFAVDPKFLREDQKVEFKEFKSKRNKIYTENARNLSRRIQVERTIQLAEEYLSHDDFWFVWQLDFRGRKYPVESFLSPQNADYSKALLEFSQSVTMDSAASAKWLAIHGANVFGVDKVSLEDREMWAYMNTENAISVYNDPLGSKWWQEADKPWQALAWCKEWAEYNIARAAGEPYETRLPCASDGSCNGLQHLSAMLRDYEGGKAVNLTPSKEPQDIYSDVAAKATALLEKEGTLMARQLLEIGVCRKICKRPVMIVPYSGTRHSCRDYIMEALEEKCKGRNPWGDNFFQPSLYLSGFVWQAISEVVVSAFDAMKYIKEIAKLYVENDLSFSWKTPTNLLVRQHYPNSTSKRVKSHLNGSLVSLRYRETDDTSIDKRKMLSGASPNFVHSLDAAALTITVSKCLDAGITDFAMVHDSYGTHSPNMPLLNDELRKAFVEMYEKHDVLLNLYTSAVTTLPKEVLVPPPPIKGTLDLKEVLQSDYFFA